MAYLRWTCFTLVIEVVLVFATLLFKYTFIGLRIKIVSCAYIPLLIRFYCLKSPNEVEKV